MKPIIRWTIGGVKEKNAYRILYYSIKKIIELYSYEFEYFVCYNDVDSDELERIKIKFKNVNFLKQKWQDCPILLNKPKDYNIYKQKLNGSFWKICPPRLRIDRHEIILDNDLIFLKKPDAIQEFLSRNDKNLIIQDCLNYMGNYIDLNENQGYNSGVIGLKPGYDFAKELSQNWVAKKSDYNYDYGEEQGFLTTTLLKTNPIIGSSEDFVGLFSDFIMLNSLSVEIANKYKLDKSGDLKKNEWKLLQNDLLKDIFDNVPVVHFLTANRNNHDGWNYFLKKFLLKKIL